MDPFDAQPFDNSGMKRKISNSARASQESFVPHGNRPPVHVLSHAHACAQASVGGGSTHENAEH
eukprot:scaffold21267_cov32-Tisochrysis_lutea.AAC.2